MADGQVGGNESVHWIVNADDATDVESVPEGRPKWLQCGIDYHRNPDLGKDFTVRIKVPANKVRRAIFLRSLLARVNAAIRDPKVQLLEVRLPIETGPVAHTQVQVTWGKETPWYEGLREVHPVKAPGVKGNGATGATSGVSSPAPAAVKPARVTSAGVKGGGRKRSTRGASAKS